METGTYDHEAQELLLKNKAHTVLLLVLSENVHDTGLSVCTINGVGKEYISDILRDLADMIEIAEMSESFTN